VSVSTLPHAGADAFHHDAVVYAGTDDFVAQMSAFLKDGVASGEASLAIVSQSKVDHLRAALGEDAERVEFADMAVIGANPARIIPVWRDFVDRHAGDERPLRGIGEPVWRERSADELIECQRHEALINLAFTGAPMWLVCPYDRTTLSPDVIEAARCSHPVVRQGAQATESTSYQGAGSIPVCLDTPLPAPDATVEALTFTGASLAQLRRAASRQAAIARLPAQRIADTVAAVHEVATNSVRHGGGGGVLRTWRSSDGLVCEVQDAGRIDDPLLGRVRPPAGVGAARGMWLVHQLCDLVQVRSTGAGTTVRMHLRPSR
jgi:anti-sigma regulatory factor (Ser/Thr protein kinase)